ncbi:hypothetical protein WICMUC_005849 [Wickerhamomyces mucosus]|uniref:CAP-Gly domain-containing protein n=1 Tax=Wickerhamomyces mucosus TaxID=1378264 RepID=A0A9P8T343_9ASCO|nr:hypothetical protein WICMUC_005849 [Wickerhamomyces mucosus]
MTIEIGDSVKFKGHDAIVRFIGETQFAPGDWVGLELNIPMGKNNGSINGIQYFQCLDNYGIFTRINTLDENLIDEGNNINTNEERLKLIISKLQDKLYSMNQKIESLNSKLENSGKEEQNLKELLNNTNEDIEILTIDKEMLDEKIELLNQDIENLKLTNQNLTNQLIQLKELLPLDSMEIIERNLKLEQALIKLRDYSKRQQISFNENLQNLTNSNESDLKIKYNELLKKLNKSEQLIKELQINIESSLNSTEIIEKLTQENFKLMEENKSLKDNLIELEELNKFHKDIESLNKETEIELLLNIETLQKIIDEKDLQILKLQNSLNNLNTNQDLKEISNFDNEQNSNFLNLKKIRDFQFQIAKLSREKQEFKKRLIFSQFENSINDLNFVKIVKIFQYLSDSIEFINDQDFHSFLFKVKYKLHLMNFISLLNSITVQSSYELQSLQLIKTQVSNNIIEDDFGKLPIFQSFSLKDNSISKLILELSIELNHLQILQIVLKGLKEINNKFAKMENKDFEEIVNKFIKWFEENIGNLKSLNPSIHDIKLIEGNEFFKISTQITRFIEILSTKSSSIEYETSNNLSLNPQITELIQIFNNSSIHSLKPLNFEIIELQINSEIKQTDGKDELIEQLELKIGILNSRLTHLSELEQLIKKYKLTNEELNQTNIDLNNKLDDLFAKNSKLVQDLNKLKNNSILYNESFNNLKQQRENQERDELLYKIHNLQRTIKNFKIHQFTNGYNSNQWLKIEFPKFNAFQLTDLEKIRRLGDDLRKSVKYNKIR